MVTLKSVVMKRKILFPLALLVLFAVPAKGSDLLDPTPPHKFDVIEALITQHKTMMQYLDLRAEHELGKTTTQAAKNPVIRKFNEIRQEFDKRFGNAYSWVVFGGDAAQLLMKCYNVSKLETEFITKGSKLITKYPECAFVIKNVQKEFGDSLVSLKNLIASMAVEGTPLGFATHEQRLDVVWSARRIVASMETTLYHGNDVLKWVEMGWEKINPFKALIEDGDCKKIADSVISKFKQKQEES